jgi:hypothetical protein
MEPYVRCCRSAHKHPEVRLGIPPVQVMNPARLQGRSLNRPRVSSLLNDPNTGSPANVEASNLYKDNRKEYTKRVRETVEKSWED